MTRPPRKQGVWSGINKVKHKLEKIRTLLEEDLHNILIQENATSIELVVLSQLPEGFLPNYSRFKREMKALSSLIS